MCLNSLAILFNVVLQCCDVFVLLKQQVTVFEAGSQLLDPNGDHEMARNRSRKANEANLFRAFRS